MHILSVINYNYAVIKENNAYETHIMFDMFCYIDFSYVPSEFFFSHI